MIGHESSIEQPGVVLSLQACMEIMHGACGECWMDEIMDA